MKKKNSRDAALKSSKRMRADAVREALVENLLVNPDKGNTRLLLNINNN